MNFVSSCDCVVACVSADPGDLGALVHLRESQAFGQEGEAQPSSKARSGTNTDAATLRTNIFLVGPRLILVKAHETLEFFHGNPTSSDTALACNDANPVAACRVPVTATIV